MMHAERTSKIVVVTESTLEQWFDGLALIVRHFIRHLPETVACDVWSLGNPGDALTLNSNCDFHTLIRPKEARSSWLLRMIGFKTSHAEAARRNETLHAACEDADAILIFSAAQSAITSWIVHHWAAKTVLHLTDCASLHALRFGSHKQYVRHRLVEWSLRSLPLAAIVFVSIFDADTFRRCVKPRNSPVIALPLGVDVDKFHPRAESERDPARPFTILFTGVLSYYPNARAALFIARELLPLLPLSARVIIAGMEPADELFKHAANDSRLTITGALPNIEAIYHEADVFIAPMMEGAGMQNKILQALASGLPVLTTPICAAAFPVLPEAIQVYPTAAAMVQAIDTFQQDEALRQSLACLARDYAVQQLSWSHRCHQLLACAGIMESEADTTPGRSLRQPIIGQATPKHRLKG